MTTLEVPVDVHASARVIGGVDTHKGAHHASVLTTAGRLLADRGFPATSAGHRDLLGWLRSFGIVHAVGVEGTGSYGAALTRVLVKAGVAVEANDQGRVGESPLSVSTLR